MTVEMFAKINNLEIEKAIEKLNSILNPYDIIITNKDDELSEEILALLKEDNYIIDNINDSDNFENQNLEENSFDNRDCNNSSQISFNMEYFILVYKTIKILEDDFDNLNKIFNNVNITSSEISIEPLNMSKTIIQNIQKNLIYPIKEKIIKTKEKFEENDPTLSLLFEFYDGKFNDEEGFYDEKLIEDAIEEVGLTEDKYGLLNAANQYNQMLTDYYFGVEWSNGTFLKENGEIDYNKLDKYLKENIDVSPDAVNRCEANQLFVNELSKGTFNGNDGEVDRSKVNDYVANNSLITDADSIINNYQIQVANTEFINNFENLFVDEEGKINKNKLNKYLEEHPKVNLNIAEQVVSTYKDNSSFLKQMENGDFFDDNGNVVQSKVEKFVEEHPNTTLNIEEVYTAYEEQYANEKLWEEYSNGTFKDVLGNWNETAYQNYIKEHPNATNGEDVKTWNQENYPDLSVNEYINQQKITLEASFLEGIFSIGEALVDGVVWLGSGIYSGVAGLVDEEYAQQVREDCGAFIATDWCGIAYDNFTEAVGIRKDIAYGKAHTIGLVGGKIVGTAVLAAIPGGQSAAAIAASAVIGGLTAAGSAVSTAINSGASVDTAYWVGTGAFTLGALSGAGLDVIAGSVEAGTLTLMQGLSTTVLVSAAEPIGNSIIEYYAYGNEMADSEGNVLYDNYLDYYVESGALLNTGIAVAGSSLRVGTSYLKGKEKVQVMDYDADGKINITEYDADDPYFSSFMSAEDMENYVDVSNMPDYPSNKTPALGAGTDNTLEVLDDVADSVDDASKGLTKVADATDIVIKRDINDTMQELLPDGGKGYEGTSVERTQARQDFFDSKYGQEGVELNTGQSELEYYVPKPGEINGEVDFIEYARTLGYSDEAIDRYIAQIESDKNWDFNEDIKTLKEWTQLSDDELIDLGIDDIQEWHSWSDEQKYNYLYNNTIVDLYEQSKVKSFRNSAETLQQTLIRFNEGEYDITPSEVIIARMNAKNGSYTPNKQIIRNGVNYTNLFPTFDNFISDSAAYNYTKQLAGITDDIIIDFCTSKGFNPSDNIEAMAYYLEHNDIYVRGTTYQNAAMGAKNLVKFGNIGIEGQLYEISLPDGSKTVRNLSYDYTEGRYYYRDNKLEKNIFVLEKDINFSNQYATSGGAYVLLSSDATIAKNFGFCCELVGDKLVITDMEKFGDKVLSGVQLDNVSGAYRITYDVPINSCSMPSVNNCRMFTDYGVPGGKLLSGEYETVITVTNVEQYLRSAIVDGEKVFEYNGDFRIVTDEGKIILVEKLDQVKK